MKKQEDTNKKEDIKIGKLIEMKNELLVELYYDLFIKRIEREDKEVEVLVDKFEIHTKGKEIILENAKA